MHRKSAHILIVAVMFWSLVVVAQNNGTKINIPETVHTDERASATIEGPAIVKAGEAATFSVTLDRPPNFDGGRIYADFYVNDKPVGGAVVYVNHSARTYVLQVNIPIDSPAATWELKKLGFFAGNNIQEPLTMSHPISFRVLPASGLTYPTSADVTINLSQAQLLRTEAITLQRQLQDLKALLASTTRRDVHGILGRAVQSALDYLNSTEASFRKLATADATDAAKVFFEDLRLSYNDAASAVSASANPSGGQLIRVSQKESVRGNYPPAAYAVLRSFEQNELAYTVVADTQSLVFDLGVQSVPAGATVCYHRKTDPCHQHPNQTNSTIPSLPYAIWIVHFEKPGYQSEDREHDPFREPNHIVIVEMKK